MVFSSVLFLFRFLPIFFGIYYLTYIWPAARRMRNIILLLGSLVFYAWGEPVYVVLLLFSTVSDYLHGLLLEKCRRRFASSCVLVSSLIINLGVLCFFKYADFVLGVLGSVLDTDIPLLHLPLPIGVSFYTFQTMSYTIDVYRGKAKVQKSLLDFAVFVTMFPQLIAGPIVRYTDVEPDLRDHMAGIEDIYRGIVRFIFGLAKKVLLANQLGLLWEEAAVVTGGGSVLAGWVGVIGFALQIYFDFSGYSDMAIGLGAMLGFRFPENFRYPYISGSVTEFWRRWHMSLSQWFRDYVYIPLGGNRKGTGRQILNILIVWMLTGIWHGAGVNFLLWGLWFALFLILEKIGFKKILDRLPKIFGWIYAAMVVLIGWVIFAVEDVTGIIVYLETMFGAGQTVLYNEASLFLLKEYALILGIGILASLPLGRMAACSFGNGGNGIVTAVRRLFEVLILSFLLLASVACIVDASYNPFLYFRF